MPRRILMAVWLALGLLLPPLLLPAAGRAPRALSASPTLNFAAPQFEQTWSHADLPVLQGAVARSWLWGPQPGEVRAEPFAGSPGGVRMVQYFDKGRMEVNGAATDASSPWATTTGLLVVEMVSGR